MKIRERVKDYEVGDYFGECALLKCEPRAASVIAKCEVKVAVLDKTAFNRLMGPLQNILKRNMTTYINYCSWELSNIMIFRVLRDIYDWFI